MNHDLPNGRQLSDQIQMQSHHQVPAAAPELDASTGLTAVLLLVGVLAVLRAKNRIR